MKVKTRPCTVSCVAVSLPTGLVFGLLGWSVYVDMGLLLPHWLRSETHGVAALGIAQATAYLLLWSLSLAHFLRAFITDNSPSSGHDGHFSPPSDIPICRKCGSAKPARCHHCSTCGRCCLKLDHHCPWVGNCVGFRNYKFFFMFLFFALLLCLYIIATSTPYILQLIKHWSAEFVASAEQVQTVVHAFVALVFGLSVAMLFFMHCALVVRNQTTLESSDVGCSPAPRRGGINGSRSQPINPFDLGSRIANIEQVFGTNKLLWFLPIFTSLGDGFTWPTRSSSTQETDRLAIV